ncbi:Atc1 protein [Rhodovulum sp. P5]|uniref:hypothetical protein n=1 Tax=Rhodovulum sp. P5 TaxID=1564506 RepID=UPI0009C34A7D|nr:hypothetical protein [Rhodovulum sp. P5]ARE39221.1 Atc1 protein [Rhodovulum sp. P5]
MSISKLCADHLRQVHERDFGQKLKASHAREIVAAFFGYRSHAAQLAETNYPLSGIEDATVMVPDVSRIEWRLGRLNGLPPNLPSAMELARIITDFLIGENWFGGKVWLYETLGNFVVEEYLRENDSYISDELSGEMAGTNAYFEDFPDYEPPDVIEGQDEVQVVANGTLSGSQDLDRPYVGHEIGFSVTMTLNRVAGRTCFQEPDIEVGGAVDDGFYGFNDEAEPTLTE